MVKIIMHGCNGHMGQVISGLVEKDPDAEIVAGIDVTDQGKNSYPVYTNMEECQVEADALIDFSSAKATGKKSGRRSRDEAFVSHGTAFTACYGHSDTRYYIFRILRKFRILFNKLSRKMLCYNNFKVFVKQHRP